MPKIPVYESQLNATRGATLDVSSPQTYMPFAGATMETGAMLEQRGAKMLEDYDTTQAYAAFNQLQDKSREKLAELGSREGADAIGAQAEYTDFFKQAKEAVTKESITAFSQRSLFDKLAERHQAGDLDALARHEFSQLKRYKDTVTEGYVARQTVRAGQMAHDENSVNEIVANVAAKIDNDNPGFDNDAKIIAARQAIYVRAVDELINTDTKQAAKMLDVWKDGLGDKYTPLKNRLERETKEDSIDNAFVLLKTMNPKDDNKSLAMLNDLSFLKANNIEVKERQQLINVFENSIRWNKYQQEEYRKDVTDKTAQTIIQLKSEGRFDEARRVLSEAGSKGIHATDITHLESYVSTAETNYTDSDVYNDAQQKIESLEIVKPSQIDTLTGVSKADKIKLKQNLKDFHDNPDRNRIIADGMKAYELEFASSPEMLAMKPFVDARIRKEARDENLGPDAILERIRTISGTMDDIYGKGAFGISWMPGGEKTSRAPVGAMMESKRSEGKAASESRKNSGSGEGSTPTIVTPQQRIQTGDMPPAVRDHVGKVLQTKGVKATDANIKKFYQQNKVRVDAEAQKIGGVW